MVSDNKPLSRSLWLLACLSYVTYLPTSASLFSVLRVCCVPLTSVPLTSSPFLLFIILYSPSLLSCMSFFPPLAPRPPSSTAPIVQEIPMYPRPSYTDSPAITVYSQHKPITVRVQEARKYLSLLHILVMRSLLVCHRLLHLLLLLILIQLPGSSPFVAPEDRCTGRRMYCTEVYCKCTEGKGCVVSRSTSTTCSHALGQNNRFL